jgi:ABC-type multidrug transport system ATPase subunit/CRP-like cAMP-binding protein
LVQTSEPADVLARVPIFVGLTEQERLSVAGALEQVDLRAGEPVFREGEDGDAMYIIAHGQARAVSDAATEKVIFAHLGPGEFFGEMSLMTGEPRSAAVIATTDLSLLRLRKAHFEALLDKHPDVSEEIAEVLMGRVQRGNQFRFQNEAFPSFTLTPERASVAIGRSDDNDLVIADPRLASHHARIQRADGHWKIEDLGTQAGTYVNRRRVREAVLTDGDEIWVGTNRVFLDGLTLKRFVLGGGVRIEARNVTRTVGDGRVILADLSLCVYPGEFVVLVGGSGTGKTSLLHALNGFVPATSGSVTFNGVDIYANMDVFRTGLGYVPQDDIIHPELTVERTLQYAARLRLPDDTTTDEVDKRVAEVLEEVGLSERRKVAVKRLSGGQRKRVSLAVELLSRPRVFFLDEPTSGLDASLDARLMGQFRTLSEHGVTVLLTTHNVANLRMADKICWLGRGGRLVFFGSPPEALKHFGVREFSEVYRLLESDEEVEQWEARFKESAAYQVNIVERLEMPAHPPATLDGAAEAAVSGEPAAAARTRRKRPSAFRQWYWLTKRYAEVVMRDRRNLALLLIQAPAIGIAMALIFRRGIFQENSLLGGDAQQALFCIEMLLASAIWLGAMNAAREIAKEAPIFARERLVNLQVVPYVLSKVGVLAVLCLIQAAILLGVVALKVDFGMLGWDVYPQLLALLFATSMASTALGLLASSVLGNSDRAMAIVPVLLIPQLIFSGALVPVTQMVLAAEWLSALTINRWALELGGSITELSPRFLAQVDNLSSGMLGGGLTAIKSPYPPIFDDVGWTHWLIIAAFFFASLAATIWWQGRKPLV